MDRFIPNREGIDLVSTFKLLDDETSPSVTPKKKKRDQYTPLDYQASESTHPRAGRGQVVTCSPAEEADRQYSLLLRNEIFGDTVPQRGPNHRDAVYKTRAPDPDQHMNLHRCDTPDTLETATYTSTPMTPHKNMFQYMSPRHVHLTGNAQAPTPKKTPRRGDPNMDPEAPIYNLSPIRLSSQQMLLAPRYKPRQVDSQPFRVLDAPDLADDYYLNLIDWGTDGCLAVGLGRSVYLWNAETQKVNKLCKLESGDTVTSVSWIQKGSHIAVGTNKGMVQIWDAARTRRLRTMTGHTGRVGSLAWNDHILSTGSRDKTIYHRDVRQPEQFLRKLSGHKQEICGLRWNAQDGQLASGGNDNKLVVWDKLEEKPLWEFTEHTAAVKAVAWSPHQRGLLASGGGTADRRILFHNTKTGELINEIDTGSQVCNLAWSKNSNEIVSTHGYSQNQIIIWKYPSMKQVCTLVGHTYRVLYLAMSPDGTTIVTGAGDETLRFWKAFQEKQQKGAGVGMDFDNVGMMGHGHIIR